MRCLIGFAALAALAVGSLFSPARAAAAEKSAVELLPASTAVYLEIARPGDLIALLDSPAPRLIEKSPQYAKALKDPKFQKLQQVIRATEERGGIPWRRALENGTAGGVSIAFDPAAQGVVILAKAQDPTVTASFRDAFFAVLRDLAAKNGDGDPIEAVDYRDLKAWKIGEGVVAQIGSWLIVTNKADLATKMADQFLDGGASLAADPQFQQSRQLPGDPSDGCAWAFVRLDPFRAMSEKPPWLDPNYKSENPAIEFLVGGLAPLLRSTPYLAAALTVRQDEVKLVIAAPNDPKWVTAGRKYFFAPPGDGAAKPLKPPGTMLSISMYRDVSAMWQSGPDLFSDAVAAQMAQADSGLSTFFGGKSFSADVLGAIKPQLQFVAAKQDFKAAGVPVPSLRLPGGALVLRIKPEKFDTLRRRFRVAFQSGVALANLGGATQGRPVLEIQTEKRGDVEILSATYDLTDKATAKDDIYLNFSPSLVMSRNYLVLCSTKQIAGDLADLIVKEGDTLPTIAENTLIEIDAAGAAALIKDDREQLIAQNMLEKGHDRAAAEKDIDGLREIVNYFRSATLRLTPAEQTIRLEVDVKLKGAQSGR